MIRKKKDMDRPELSQVVTLIGPDSVFEGNLETGGNICIEGVFRGRLKTEGGVIVNSVGRVEAEVLADHVVVHGTIVGNISARKQLDICATGRVKGDVEAEVVTVSKGGILDGFCKMLNPKMDHPQLESQPSLKSPLSASDEDEPRNIGNTPPGADDGSGLAVSQ